MSSSLGLAAVSRILHFHLGIYQQSLSLLLSGPYGSQIIKLRGLNRRINR